MRVGLFVIMCVVLVGCAFDRVNDSKMIRCELECEDCKDLKFECGLNRETDEEGLTSTVN